MKTFNAPKEIVQNNHQDYQMIDSKSQLKKAVDEIGDAPILAVDLEADSLHHYKEKVCLIQMATPDITLVVDPLKIDDLSALKPIFASQHTLKVLHGADYDVRSLYRDFQIEIHNLFDTELACRFLGVAATGLDAVLAERYDVALVKKYRKRDWTQRPLPAAMLAYGVADVLYLIDLVKELKKELKEKRRLSWVAEECALLSQVRSADNSKGPLFFTFRGAGRLDPTCLTVLEALLALRHELAAVKDRPLFKVIANTSLLAIAQDLPESLDALAKSGALSPKQIHMFGDKVMAAVAKALKVPEDKKLVYPRKKAPRLKRQAPPRINALKIWRDQMAETLAIDPALILNRNMITNIAVRNPQSPGQLDTIEGLKQWQIKAFGPEIIKALASA